jgi:hypothetical protein
VKRHIASAAAVVVLVACKGIVDPLCGCSMPAPESVIRGTVTDPSDAPVSGATVQVRVMVDGTCAEPGTTVIRTSTSDAEGRFRHAEAWTGGVEKCFSVRAEAPAGSALAASESVLVRLGFDKPDSVAVALQLR